MTPEPTPQEAPAEPEIMVHEPSIEEAKAMSDPEPETDNITPIHGPADAAPPPPPTPDQIEAARKAVEEDMRDAVPFNRLAIHTGFQRAIQAAVVSTKPEKAGSLCSAFRNYAEAESLLRG